MAKDIAVELWEKIELTFDSRVKTDPIIKAFNRKVEKETAEGKDTFKYVERLGEHASSVLSFYITPENMPDGKIYWNIAQRTVLPLLKKVHEMVNDAACAVQEIEDKKNGIGIKAVRAPFPEDRVNDLLNKLTSLDLTAEDEDE